MRYLRFAASLLLCLSAVPVLVLSARGLIVIPRFLGELGPDGVAPEDAAVKTARGRRLEPPRGLAEKM